MASSWAISTKIVLHVVWLRYCYSCHEDLRSCLRPMDVPVASQELSLRRYDVYTITITYSEELYMLSSKVSGEREMHMHVNSKAKDIHAGIQYP